MNVTPHKHETPSQAQRNVNQALRCAKCTGCLVEQQIREDTLTVAQWRCLNCGLIEEPGLVPNARRIAYTRSGKYSTPSAEVIRRRERLKEQQGDGW